MLHYIPSQGDLVILTFDPQSGHEQKGRRPAIVVSKTLFNKATRLALVCPITNTDRQIPFHIRIPEDSPIHGFVMAEQLKSVDYVSRNVKFVAKASDVVLNEVLSILDSCIFS